MAHCQLGFEINSLKNNRVYNFAYCGYHAGTELPARNLNLPEFWVNDFGAIPNDGLDDVSAIQAAVDAAAAAGGGVVRFPPGKFDFALPGNDNYVKIAHSNIVLRGYGEGVDGTYLIDHYPSRALNEAKMWTAGYFPAFFKIEPAQAYMDSLFIEINKVGGLKPQYMGARFVVLQNLPSRAIKPNSYYLITMKDRPDSSLAYYLHSPLRKLPPGLTDTTADAKYRFRQLVKVTHVRGNTLYLEQPLCIPLFSQWQPEIWLAPNMIEECGIENFRMISRFEDTFIHHLNSVHDNGFDHIRLHYAANCWVRNTTHIQSSTAVTLDNSISCVVYDSHIEGKTGHNGYVVASMSSGNLLFNLYGGQQMHTFSLNGYASGNAFYNCHADEPSAIDCHGVQGVNNLFDNIYGPVLRSGGSNMHVPPFHARGLVIYNWSVGLKEPYKNSIYQTMAQTAHYPMAQFYYVRGKYGQPVYFQSSKGLRSRDFKDKYAVVKHLNSHRKLKVHASLLLQQRRLLYGKHDPIFLFNN